MDYNRILRNAVKNGQINKVKLLGSMGIINKHNPLDLAAIAALHNDLNMIKYLLEQIELTKDKEGHIALIAGMTDSPLIKAYLAEVKRKLSERG